MLLVWNLGCTRSYTLDGQKRSYAINEHEDVLSYHEILTKNRDKLDAFMARSIHTVRVEQ
ncbi:hypothetical protein [Paenibacillus terrigena]|uniref:hypothetical protein n=1 Tax=Paenibacillus terrigena TaxID=369333 RepID=UPI0028D62A64|nr:hypothetical protein [Paenibacillus terrigena]